MSERQDSSCNEAADAPHAPNGEYVIGVDIGGTNLRLAIASTAGQVLARWSTKTIGIDDPSRIVAMIDAGVTYLLDQQSSSRDRLLAIGVGAPGVTDVKAGIVLATSYLMGWHNVPLQQLLESAIGVPVVIDNDVNIGAVGERWIGTASNEDNFVFIAIGSGVGAGIFLNGHLFRGSNWMAGEIGYMLVPGTSEELVDPSQPGPLEEIVGGEGIRKHWRKLLSENKSILPPTLTATEIFDLALTGETLAREILEQAARVLAYAINNLMFILNCPLFILGGRLGMHPALCEATRQILKRRDAGISPRLMISTLGEDAQLLGAVKLAIDRVSQSG